MVLLCPFGSHSSLTVLIGGDLLLLQIHSILSDFFTLYICSYLAKHVKNLNVLILVYYPPFLCLLNLIFFFLFYILLQFM